MKENLKNLMRMTIFLLLLLWSVDFKIKQIFDVKLMLIMMLCIVILTISAYKDDKSELKSIFGYQIALTSIFGTSLLFLQEFSKASVIDFYKPLHPILYGIIYYVLGNVLFNFKTSQIDNQIDVNKILCDQYGLTIREVAVATELLKGKSNKEIASKLFIAESTVKKHVHNIFQKTTSASRDDFIQLFKEV